MKSRRACHRNRVGTIVRGQRASGWVVLPFAGGGERIAVRAACAQNERQLVWRGTSSRRSQRQSVHHDAERGRRLAVDIDLATRDILLTSTKCPARSSTAEQSRTERRRPLEAPALRRPVASAIG